MSTHTSKLLEKLSSGHQLTIDELDDLIKHKVKEDQFLEFKSGQEVEDKDAAKTIRDYMCGFANSDGGVLIIGVDTSSGIPIKIDGCNNHKKGDLAEWATRCLTEIASYFSPIPKFQVLHHPNGEILVSVAQRSLNLIPQIENKQLIYNLRIHDQTLKAPEYLMSDLLLGRKQKPDFDIVDYKAFNFWRNLDTNNNSMDLGFELRIKCESRNIVWAEESRWGVIAWTQFRESMHAATVNQPSGHLLSFVDVQDLPSENQIRPGVLLHFSNNLNISKPFDTGHVILSLNTPIRFGDQWFSYDWMAALYLVAKNSPPLWYQIDLKINIDSSKWVDDKTIISPNENSNLLTVTKLISERPIVAWKTSL
jgi:hypothetical protein